MPRLAALVCAVLALAGCAGSDDQPTEFLQNDYIHRFRHLKEVPTEGTRRSPEFLAGAAATRWFGRKDL